MEEETMKYILITLIFLLPFRENKFEEDFTPYYCEIQYKTSSIGPDNLLNFTSEGLICSVNDSLGNRKTMFFKRKDLNPYDIMRLQKHIMNERFMLDSNYYTNSKGRVIDGWQYNIIVREDNQFNVITYVVCREKRLDKLIQYMNQLIPVTYRNEFQIDISKDKNLDDCKKSN